VEAEKNTNSAVEKADPKRGYLQTKGRSLTWYLVQKYLRFDRSQPFITISALLAFIGVGIGIMVLIVAMAIMNGFDKEFEEKLFTMNYPMTVYSKGMERVGESDLQELRTQFPHLKFSPFITTQAIIKHGDRLEGGVVFGVDFASEKQINKVVKEALGDREVGKYEILIGSGYKDSLTLYEGKKVTLIFTNTEPTGLSLIPTMKRFIVHSFFTSGLIAYDKAYIYTSLESLQKITKYKKGRYDGIHIYSDDPFVDIEKLRQQLPIHLGVLGWWQLNGNFFSALAMEKRALFIVLMLIILVASLNIISSLLMTVMNRRKEIALLLSLGATKKEIKKTFFYLGSIIGGGGVILGTLLGFLGLFLLGTFDIIDLPADVYGTAKLPLELSFYDLCMIEIGAIVIVILSSYYPSYKATQIDVIKTLRNE
jgi:putative ABC transport system permease protein